METPHFPLSNAEQDTVLSDPDSFVRACVWENPHRLPYRNDWEAAFGGCTHLERLAMMRNPELPDQLVERIFDPADAQMEIDSADRHQLAVALLANTAFVAEKQRLAAEDPICDHGSARRFLTRLWDLASAWPENAGVRLLTYRHVNVDEATKGGWYEKSTAALRDVILGNCGPNDRWTLELAMTDSDAGRRGRAYATVDYLSDEELARVLASADKEALEGAGTNELLPLAQRSQIAKRAQLLDAHPEDWMQVGWILDVILQAEEETARAAREEREDLEPESEIELADLTEDKHQAELDQPYRLRFRKPRRDVPRRSN